MNEAYSESSTAVVLVNQRGYITSFDSAAADFYGYQEKFDIGLSIFSIIPQESHEQFTRILSDVTTTSKSRSFEARRINRDGEKINVFSTVSKLLDRNGNTAGYSIVDRKDILNKNSKQLCKAINNQHANELAKQSNRYKSEFLANISHEIKTPLSTIIGYAELIAESSNDPSIKEFFAVIKKNSSHLQNLINDILDLSKIEAGKLEIRTQCISLINELAELKLDYQQLAQRKNLEFSFKFRGPTPRFVVTDPTRFRQILNNIIGNAIKYTEEGKVTVTFSLDKKNEFLSIVVSDTGLGISEEDSNRIFAPFVQGDSSSTRKYGGSGLGLVLAKRLAESLGGKLDLIFSKLDYGSTFQIKIPTGKLNENDLIHDFHEEKMKVSFQSEMSHVPSLSGMKILLVEDSMELQLLIQHFFRQTRAKVFTANNGKIAIEKCREIDFDIVLMDIQMPIMDGITATKQLRKRNFKKPIFALTARTMKHEINEIVQAGFNAVLSKPIDRDRLISSVANTKRSLASG